MAHRDAERGGHPCCVPTGPDDESSLIVTGNRDDPGNLLVLDGDAIDAAAHDPLAIGKL